jgi:AmmeMemoRadiSam system protein B
MNIRKADFAGSWYPGSAGECEREINSFLSEKVKASSIENLVGGIVPHAGWYFSGSIACNVIHSLNIL